jgi:beta-phosphoglucomutase-like phosphatase (HAD superfamily)
MEMILPALGKLSDIDGFLFLNESSCGTFEVGKNGVNAIVSTGDKKVEFIAFDKKSIALVKSELGYPAYYPVGEVSFEKPVKGVLMDLDGTSVRSEEFWIWIIEMTTASLLKNPKFELSEEDVPFVSGHSVSEHLQYCINKYAQGSKLEDARNFYFEHTRREMQLILDGKGRADAFTPTPGLKDFLLELKDKNIKIGLVTSGLFEKAWPEIVAAFRTLKMGDPREFYDAIISAGYPIRKGEVGTLGELCPKPHPWLYTETAQVGLGLSLADRSSIVGIEDSGAGVCSIRLAGYTTIGIDGGNIEKSGTKGLCDFFCNDFEQIKKILL